MVKSTFDLEKKLISEGYKIIIGIDEAGRGPLAGPVVACATAVRNFQFPISNFQTNSNDQISNDKSWDLVRDSKALSEKQREEIFDFIHENFYVGVGICDHKTIDRINILEATYLAAKIAVADLFRKLDQDTRNNDQTNHKSQVSNHKQVILLFDGNKKIPNFSYEQKTVVGGDRLVKSISAASIVAKVTRDRIMREMHEKYLMYGFDSHKGYGTAQHLKMLQEHGPCEIHRKSFKPVKVLLKKKM